MKLGSFVPSKGNYSPCRMQTNKQMQINQEKHGGFFSTRFNICLKLTNPAGNSQVLFFPIQIHSWLSLEMLVWVTVQQGGIWLVGRAIPEPQSAPKTIPPQKKKKIKYKGRWAEHGMLVRGVGVTILLLLGASSCSEQLSESKSTHSSHARGHCQLSPASLSSSSPLVWPGPCWSSPLHSHPGRPHPWGGLGSSPATG